MMPFSTIALKKLVKSATSVISISQHVCKYEFSKPKTQHDVGVVTPSDASAIAACNP